MKSATSPALRLLLSLVVPVSLVVPAHVLMVAPAHAQINPSGGGSSERDAVLPSLTELLSLTTLGMVTTQQQAAQVTRSGADYLVRLPLSSFAAPPDAAVSAVARPMSGGMWNITSMTLPSTGIIEPTAASTGTDHAATDHAGTGRITYSLGEQTIHGVIDPTLIQPSSFAAILGNVRAHFDQGDSDSDQAFARYMVDGTMVAEPTGKLNFALRNKATNWHLTTHTLNGVETTAAVRALSGHLAVDGLDRAQGLRLFTAARGLTTGNQTLASNQPLSRPPLQHRDARALVDAIPGLLTKFQAEESLDDIGFTFAPARSGTMGHLRVTTAGNIANELLNAQADIAMDGLAMTTLPAETAAYIPRHLQVKAILAGMRTEPLIALLRAAAGPDADFPTLLQQFMTLSGEAGTRISIESLTFDAGPLRVAGSAKFTPRASGQAGADIHLTATGMDALIAQSQGNPALQRGLPVMFIAKGMARPEGDAMTWDIALGDGSVTINGMTLGQPVGRKR